MRDLKKLMLRPGLASDIEAMYQLDVLCFSEPFRFNRFTMSRYAQHPRAIVVVVEQDDAIGGFIILHVSGRERRTAAYMVTLDVHPDLRQQGVATVLVEEAERQAREAGATRLSLHVHTGNEAAIRFYERLGFSATQFHPDLYAPGLDGMGYLKLLASL